MICCYGTQQAAVSLIPIYRPTIEGSILAPILMMWMRRADPTLGRCS
eukprot:COSAG01_NODE_1751_length_9323_cov_5.197507_10_plen_47_part_00